MTNDGFMQFIDHVNLIYRTAISIVVKKNKKHYKRLMNIQMKISRLTDAFAETLLK